MRLDRLAPAVHAAARIMLALALSAFGLGAEPAGQPAGNGRRPERVALQLRFAHQFQFAGYYAAVEQGYYREAGLDVEMREGTPSCDVLEEVLSGKAEYGVSGSQLIQDYANGKPVVVLAAIFQHNPSVLAVLRASGIRSPQDLAGKRVMMRRDIPTPSLLLMLAAEGVPLESLRLVPHTFNLDDLIEGRIDAYSAYVTTVPHEFRRRGVAYQLLEPIDYGIDFYGDCLFTSRHEAGRHAERTKAFLRASLRGWAYAMDHVEAMTDLIRRRYAPDRDPDELKAEASEIRRLMMPDIVEVGHMNPGRWRTTENQMREAGLLDTPDGRPLDLDRFLFDPNNPRWDQRWVRTLEWVALGILIAAGLLVIANRSLTRAIRRRTGELSLANRRLVGENEERLRAQALLRLQRDLAIQMGNQETVHGSLDVLLETMLRVTGAETGCVYLESPGTGGFELAAQTGLSGRFVENVRRLTPDSRRAAILRTGRTLLLGEAEMRDDPYFAEVREEGIRAGMAVPVTFEGRVIGLLNIASRSLSAFPENTVTAIEAASMQIGGLIARLQMVEALRESEQKFRTLADSAPHVILVTGKDGRFVYVNAYATVLLGYPAEALIGLSFKTFLPSREADRLIARFRNRLEGGVEPARYDTFIRCRDGHLVLVEVSARLIRWGGMPAVLGHCVDLTERRRLEDEIVKVSQWEKQRIGHDLHDSLGQQLTGIAYLCQALEGRLTTAGAGPPAGQAAHIGEAVREAIEQVRRIVRGLAPVDMEEGGLAAALKRLAEEARSTWGIACVFEDALPTPVHNVQTASHLYHIAQEALTNAVRHGKARRVEIRLSGNREKGELAVSDDGRGMQGGSDNGRDTGSGIKIMRYRAELIGGQLSFQETERGGLTVRCAFDTGTVTAEWEGSADENG